MRRNPQRPRSRDGSTVSPRPAEPPTKKIFNCIVDDSALLAGAKKSTRDGIRKWIANGQIRLFVPLYTLAQATRLKDGSGRISSDAEDALVWLDDATSSYPHLVTLQGGYEKFESWAEVEQFALPETLFSERDHLDDELDGASLDVAQHTGPTPNQSTSSADTDGSRSVTPSSPHSERSSVSAVSPPESPVKSPARARLQKPNTKSTARNTAANGAPTSGVPAHLRALYNYIMWRVHQEIDPVAALESFVFLTDDPTKIGLAQRFGIRTKSLADIRYVVAREEREFKNRQLVQRKESETNSAQPPRPSPRAAAAAVAPVQDADAERPELLPVDERPAPVVDDDEDEILLKRPPKAPAAMLAQQQSPKVGNKLIDPNQFSRGSPANARANTRGGGPRGGATRGRGAPFTPASTARGSPNGATRVDLTPATGSGPIDPNSFTRPSANTNRFRGGRRLWVPT